MSVDEIVTNNLQDDDVGSDDGIASDADGQGYRRFVGSPSQADLERCFFLDDTDLGVVRKCRGDSNRVGFAVQLGTVRFLGTFLADPTDVPFGVVEYVAGQVGASDPSCLKRYMHRRQTRFEHAANIVATYGYLDFASQESVLSTWLDDRAWTTCDGPKALFDGAVAWMLKRRVLLPGRFRLEKLVGQIREAVNQRVWDALAGMVTPPQARVLESMLDVDDGARVSRLEQLRTGPTVASGKAMTAALDRIARIAALGLGGTDLGVVPQRRVVELARWGMAGKATLLRRHPGSRRLATLLATVVYLEGKATDDALQLFELLMTNDLLARAQREAKTDTLRRYPRVSRALTIRALPRSSMP